MFFRAHELSPSISILAASDPSAPVLRCLSTLHTVPVLRMRYSPILHAVVSTDKTVSCPMGNMINIPTFELSPISSYSQIRVIPNFESFSHSICLFCHFFCFIFVLFREPSRSGTRTLWNSRLPRRHKIELNGQ